jgi:hypothetical protein
MRTSIRRSFCPDCGKQNLRPQEGDKRPKVPQIRASATDRYSPLCGQERSREDAVPVGAYQGVRTLVAFVRVSRMAYMLETEPTCSSSVNPKCLRQVPQARTSMPLRARS